MNNMQIQFQKEIDELNRLFDFSVTGDEQDWDIEFCNKDRIEEFLLAYEKFNFTKSQKIALIELIIASFDELLMSGKDNPKIWQKIADILKSEKEIHEATINYWACLDDSSEVFEITHRIRDLKRDAF